MIKLLRIEPSGDGKHKFVAVFENTETKRQTITRFGAKGMSDQTKHKDPERKERQRARHKRDLRTGDPKRAGYLSYFILWNKPTLSASVADYRRRLAIYNRTGKFPID